MVLAQMGTGMVGAVDRLFGSPDSRRLAMARLNAAATAAAAQRDLHNLLAAYRHNNSLYDWVAANNYLAGEREASIKGIRTPAARIVDFYVANLWPGPLDECFEIETENPSIIEPIEQMWEWSDWSVQKDVAADWYATYGDLFARIETPDDVSVRFKLIDPRYVSDFSSEYGHLKMIRLDIPQSETRNGVTEWLTHVEVWSKAEQSCRIWNHQHGLDAPLEDLGEPETIPFAALGIDFVPFVRAPFKDVGEQWGMGSFLGILDKIDELNLKATRHSELMYGNINTTWQAVSANPTNQPAPPLTVEDAGVVSVGDQSFFGMPSGWKLDPLVPNLQYDAYLNTIEAEEKALATGDAPELMWTRLSDSRELSGRAIGLLLTEAIKRVERSRASGQRALIRLAMMGLTIGKNAGLFPGLQGTYDAGSFQHTFKKRDVLPKDLLDEATTLKTRMDARLAQIEMLKAATPLVLEEEGYTEDQIEQIEEERREAADENEQRLAAAMTRQPTPPRLAGRRQETEA